MASPEMSVDPWAPGGIHVLLADDDERVRSLLATVVGEMDGVASVIEADDGAAAVQIARAVRVDAAVLDFNMPRLDGVEAAVRLRALQPWMRIALHSSDPDSLRARAGGLGLPLFDKLESERLVHWVERQARSWESRGKETVAGVSPLARRLDLSCSMCGYGIVSRKPPDRCPMCHVDAAWTEPRSWPARKAAAHEQSAG
jgi:CheY-like chemotaxis protein